MVTERTTQSDFYQKLRTRIAGFLKSPKARSLPEKWVEFLLLAPDLFHLMVKLTADSRVPMAQKAKLGVAIAYFVTPIDFIMEALVGPVGYVDDVAFAAFTLSSMLGDIDPKIIRDHWAGNGDVLDTIQNKILPSAMSVVGTGVWGKLRKRFGKSA